MSSSARADEEGGIDAESNALTLGVRFRGRAAQLEQLNR
jgi:hypothetical protein